jgi:hypothetical protein
MTEPRWRLEQPHYLAVVGTEWEYKEISQASGEEVRVRMPVHKYLDPKDPRFCNRDGECVVTYGDAGPREYVFTGDPTPDMVPLNDEAEAISTARAPHWKHPIETLQGNGEGLAAGWQREMAAIMASMKPGSIAPVAPGISEDQFNELKEQVAALMKQNAMLQGEVAEAKGAAHSVRRA